MKRCQNKPDMLRQSGSGLSYSRLALFNRPRLAVSVLIASVWLGAGLLPAGAQQGEPVNLLSIAPTPADRGKIAVNSPLNIDQAIDKALAVEDGEQPKTNPIIIAEPADQALDMPTEPQAAEPQATESLATESLATEPAETGLPAAANASQIAPNNGLGTNDVYSSAKIGRRNISDVGLAAIGVGDTGNSQLDSLIWRGTSARDAVFLLQKSAIASQSKAIAELAYEVVARQSVPPSGANNVAADLVEARLAFLANGGRSSDLALLAVQLPEAEKWADWRRWLTEHYLMIRDDVAACSIVSRQITQTMDPFWHKSNVICQAVQGKTGGARFAADILAANGVDDPIFFGLVNEVLNNNLATPADLAKLDPAKLDSAHIVLMDVANRPIPLEGLAVLPKQMAETVIKLKFLGPDARMVSTFDGLNRGLITHRQAGKLWRSAGQENNDPQLALAQLDGRGDALTTALAWRALDADTQTDRLALVAKAIKAEINGGNGAVMLPLYAELVRNALADESVAANMRFDDLDVAPKMAFLLAINQPNDTTTLAAFAGNGEALKAAELLRGLSGDAVDTNVISTLNMWHILPVLEAAGVAVDEQDWLDLVKNAPVSGQGFAGLPPLLLKAVTAAAEARHVAETVLLANWLLHDVGLEKTNPADLAAVIRALDMIGQGDVAKAFAHEIIAAHLMQRLAAMIPDGTQS
ncbi:hypothetical protein N8524_03790 [Candidatus Puniceispirillum sp.]|nr:hypothetical protein [Candidatus Puniceispirillum sp.]